MQRVPDRYCGEAIANPWLTRRRPSLGRSRRGLSPSLPGEDRWAWSLRICDFGAVLIRRRRRAPRNLAACCGCVRRAGQSWSMMGALLGPLLTGRKTTKLDWSCAHTGAPVSASSSPCLWGSGADAGFPARGSRGPLRALGSSARPPQQPRASPPQRAHCWPSTRAAGQTCRRSARSERQTWGHYIVAIIKLQQVPGLQAVQA